MSKVQYKLHLLKSIAQALPLCLSAFLSVPVFCQSELWEQAYADLYQAVQYKKWITLILSTLWNALQLLQVTSHTKQAEKIKKERGKDEKERERMEGEVKRMEQELQEMEDQAGKVLNLVEATQEQLAAKQAEVEKAQAEVSDIAARHGIIRKTEFEIESALEQMSKQHKEESGKVSRWQAEIESTQRKFSELTGGDTVMVDVAELDKSAEDYLYHFSVLEAELVKMSPDIGAIEDYRAKAADYEQRAAELDAVTAQRDELRRHHETLRKARLDEFMAGFNVISLKLKEMYQMITLGGDAELELVDSLDPFTEVRVCSVLTVRIRTACSCSWPRPFDAPGAAWKEALSPAYWSEPERALSPAYKCKLKKHPVLRTGLQLKAHSALRTGGQLKEHCNSSATGVQLKQHRTAYLAAWSANSSAACSAALCAPSSAASCAKQSQLWAQMRVQCTLELRLKGSLCHFYASS
ncbi:hypothetical protein DUNSADRAFT_8174 [Dunaliella salina]|uniref:Uncharacterized protein n=1 Tax=Dunaliella salina TaxID=3046 RepID=A0ABQ7GK06_DUNSA|nr:hypothetical protein DUNSADRAFT_8174 [Dunaliella salina]|eukprot:KAF5834903.1 hypothetical protein DUNSADRAFT_8174 [Dunaliella salina]